MSACVLRIKGYWRYIVRRADGEVVLRTQDAVYARHYLAELERQRPIRNGDGPDSPGEA